MKKLLSTILLALLGSMCITACTEEEVTPSTEVVTSHGKPQDPI